MKNTYRFILEPYKYKSSKHQCPNCNHKSCFTKYIDQETGNYLADDVGRCDREDKCGYHYSPKMFFEDEGVENPDLLTEIEERPEPPISLLPESLIDNCYHDNNLYAYSISKFDKGKVDIIFTRYRVGSSSRWPNSTVFYQFDKYGRCRTGKIMQYIAKTGKRVKEPYNKISWLHRKEEDFNLKQCLFGEHLIDLNDNKSVGIVESEKTALLMAIVDDRLIWLATGGLSNLNANQIKGLGSRRVVLFPDSGCADKWQAKVIGLDNVIVDRSLEGYLLGTDLADLVIKESNQVE